MPTLWAEILPLQGINIRGQNGEYICLFLLYELAGAVKIKNECSSPLVCVLGLILEYHLSLTSKDAESIAPSSNTVSHEAAFLQSFQTFFSLNLGYRLKPISLIQTLHIYHISLGQHFSDTSLDPTPPFSFSLKKSNEYFYFLNKKVTEANIFKTVSFSFLEAYHDIGKQIENLHINLYQ